jgi:hypothetical protein
LVPSSARLAKEATDITGSVRSVDCSFFGSHADLPDWLNTVTSGLSSVIRHVSGAKSQSGKDIDVAAIRTLDGGARVTSARATANDSVQLSNRPTGRLTESTISEGEAVSFALQQICHEYPQLNEQNRIVKVKPSLYLINSRSVEVFTIEGGALMVRDGPMTQPLLDYVMNTGANEHFECPHSGVEPTTAHRRNPPGIVGVETMTLNERARGMGPDQVRLSAMRYAKMAAERQEQNQENRLNTANQPRVPAGPMDSMFRSLGPPPMGSMHHTQPYFHTHAPQPMSGAVMRMRMV